MSLSDREPILNVPTVIVALALAMGVIHGYRMAVLDPETDVQFLLTFAFIPTRYEASLATSWGFPGGGFADAWTFITYAFLHGSWVHLGVNVVWLLVFGSPVARRLGALRSTLLFAVTAVAGALAHLIAFGSEFVPMVGASAAVSGFTAAALRFVFQPGGPLGGRRSSDPDAYLVPALGLGELMRNRAVMGIIALWVIMNVVFGAASLPMPGVEGAVAWQAHLGGFLAGLLLFPLFDPVKAQPAI